MTPPELSDADSRSQAAAFLVQRDAGWRDEDAAAFALWRAANPAHDAAVRQIEAAQNLLRQLPSSAAGALLSEADALYGAHPRRRFRHWGLWVGGLAAACLVLAFGLTWRNSGADRQFSAGDHLETVDLNDGSTLRLNPGSRVAVRFGDRERQILLEDGEVRFSVAKNAARPFIVTAGAMRIRVVGTAFSVHRTAAVTEVKVTEGKVQVTQADSRHGDATPLFLVAGESAQLPSGAAAAARIARAVTSGSGTTAPRPAPRLEFSRTPLSEAVARFNEYNRVQIDIGDAELARRPIGGTFDADQADSFVSLLVASGEARVERVSETHIVLRKPE